MKNHALGLIEAVGLPVAIEAADAAMKAAQVSLVGIERTKGGGYMLVKFTGDVGAVKAAVEAGVMAASRVGRIIASHVIPHPNEGTNALIEQIDRGPSKTPPPEELAPAAPELEKPAPAKPEKKPARKAPVSKLDSVPELANTEVEFIAPVVESTPTPAVEAPAEPEALIEAPAEEPLELPFEPPAEEIEEAPGETPEEAPLAALDAERAASEAPDEVCNLCGDPACPRRKGQPHRACLHYPDELKNAAQ